MAPWFTQDCKQAQLEYKRKKKAYGRNHEDTIESFKNYKKCCKKSRTQFQYLLPGVLKYNPK